MIATGLSSIAAALTMIAFDMRSRKAADDAVEAMRRARICSVPAWADLPVILALYWKLRQMRDRGIEAYVGPLEPFNGASVSGLFVANNLQLCLGRARQIPNKLAVNTDEISTNSDVFSEFVVEREIAAIWGQRRFARLCRLELGPEWYKSKWPPSPSKMYKWINVCEADLNASGLASCNEAKRLLSKLRADGIGLLKKQAYSNSLSDEFDVFSL